MKGSLIIFDPASCCRLSKFHFLPLRFISCNLHLFFSLKASFCRLATRAVVFFFSSVFFHSEPSSAVPDRVFAASRLPLEVCLRAEGELLIIALRVWRCFSPCVRALFAWPLRTTACPACRTTRATIAVSFPFRSLPLLLSPLELLISSRASLSLRLPKTTETWFLHCPPYLPHRSLFLAL